MGCFTAFISVFYVIGFASLGYSFWAARKSTQAAAWPCVPGAISSLSLHDDNDGDSSTYTVKVQYTYAVGGVAYEGSRLAFGYGGSSGKEPHDEIHRKLKASNTVAVRYDPSEPEVSCLSYGLHRSIVIGLVFSTVGLIFLAGLTFVVWLVSRSSDRVLLDNLAVQ